MILMLFSQSLPMALFSFAFVVGAGAWREFRQHPETEVILDLDLLFIIGGAAFAAFVMLI